LGKYLKKMNAKAETPSASTALDISAESPRRMAASAA